MLPVARALALLGALASTDAHALRPPEGVHVGHEPTRQRTTTAAGQARLLADAPWRAFVDAEGAGWHARFDEATGTPRRMWGPGLPVDVSSREAVARSVLALVRRHEALFGVAGAALRVAVVAPSEDRWYVDVDVLREGLPIWRGGLTFRVQAGRLVMAGADSYPNAPVVGQGRVSEVEAVRAALTEGPAPLGDHRDVAARRWLLPIEQGGRVALRVVWEVRSRTEAPVGRWVTFVAEDTGEVLSSYNEVRFVSGQLRAEVDVRLGDGRLTTVDLPFAAVATSTTSGLTDAAGRYDLPGELPLTVSLEGTALRVRDQLGDVDPRVGTASATLRASDFAGRQAPLTTWAYVHEVREWAARHAPTVPFVRQHLDAYVNIDDVCNAYFDGDVNFFRSGGGCNNTGRLADVVFHEWGHGFHTSSILSGAYDGSLGEGAADTIAFLMTDDSRIAPNFFVSGGTLRDVDNTNRWPDDYSPSDAEVHANGLIFGGAMWDTREALRRSLGEPAATDVLAGIYVRLLRGGPDIESSFDEAMFADDDDGDLGNGTPHLCALIEGFGQHGLGLAADWARQADHEVLELVEADAPIEIVAGVTTPAPQCLGAGVATGGTVFYRVDGGTWRSVQLLRAGDGVRAALPAQAPGALVEYWLQVRDGDGALVLDPPGGEIRPHTLHVGGVIPVVCDDFEADDGGYTHELVAGAATEGADDWLLGAPNGLAGDPPRAWSGDRVWGTDLGEPGWNGEYQHDKHTRLVSRLYSVPEHLTGVFLGYRRWLAVEDGYYDRASVFADDIRVWSNWATDEVRGAEHHLDDRWAWHTLDLLGAADDHQVRLAWELESDGGLAFGGWNVDDVCLYAPATPDNRLAIVDLVGEPVDGEGDVRLRWTHPAHAPVERVRVVRKTANLPTGPDDGAVVAELTGIEPGAAAEVLDETANGQQGLFYAVYASDGEDWLSWTVLGWNAALADGGAGGSGVAGGSSRIRDDLEVIAQPVGCGCASQGGPGAVGLGVLVLLAVRRRRG